MRRRLASLFVNIAGSTRLVVRHPPETMLGVVQCFAELVTDIALRRIVNMNALRHRPPPSWLPSP